MAAQTKPVINREHQITADQAVKNYGEQVIEIMDIAAQSTVEATRNLKPHNMVWSVCCTRGDSPAHITDPDDFARVVRANSVFWLAAKSAVNGARFNSRYIKLDTIPPQMEEYIMSYSILTCNQRIKSAEDAAKEKAASESVESDIKEPILNRQAAVNGVDLSNEFDKWLRLHPRADRRLAAVTRTAIINLIQSAE